MDIKMSFSSGNRQSSSDTRLRMTVPTTDLISKVKNHIQQQISFHPIIPEEKLQRMLNDEPVLQKWLNALENNPQQAGEEILATLEWREVNEVDNILEENCIGDLQTFIPVHLPSFDNAGRPVLYVPLHHWRLEKISRLARSGDFQRFAISVFELMTRERSRNANNLTTDGEKFTVIVNADGVSAFKLAKLKLIRELSSLSTILQRHYPDSILRCIVIKCGSPLVEKLLGSILPFPFLPKENGKISTVLHLQENFYRSTVLLQSIIPSEELPVECGGWKQLSEDVVDNHSLSSVTSSW